MTDWADRIRDLPRDTRACLGFFSRLPVGGATQSRDLAASSGAWPLAGAAIVALPALLLWLCWLFSLPALVTAGLAIAAMAFITGCLHEDGFADTADGFGGGETRERKLEIMRDSRIGTYGTLALILNILLRVAALAAIVAAGHGIAALFAAAMLSRSLALWHWFILSPARDDGLAVTAGQPNEQTLVIGGGLGFAALIGAIIFLGVHAVFAVLFAAVVVAVFTRLAQRQIGGNTGDTIGAAQQAAEIALLVGLAGG